MRLKYLVQDPPPLLVFEISRQGVAGVRRNPKTFETEARAYRALDPDVVQPAAAKHSVLKPEQLDEAVGQVKAELGPSKRSDAALIVPDASARLTVLDFNNFPGDQKERLQLIRFRLKKTLPFDSESAHIAYQVHKADSGSLAVVAATLSTVIGQYEAPLRKVGLEPGFVSLSTLSAINLVPDGGMTLFVKLASRSMTLVALSRGGVRLVRSIELPANLDLATDAAIDEMVGDLYPTFVFIADNLSAPVSKVVLCGFGELLPAALRLLPAELGCEVEPLRSPQGDLIESQDAGIHGYLSAN